MPGTRKGASSSSSSSTQEGKKEPPESPIKPTMETTGGKKRKGAPFRLSSVSKKRKQSLHPLSRSTDGTFTSPQSPPSPHPLSSSTGVLSSSLPSSNLPHTPKNNSHRHTGTPIRTPKRPSQKKKTAAQLHLTFFNNALECLLEASDMNSDWVDRQKCQDPEIQTILRSMLRCLLLFVWRSVVTHIYASPFLVPVKESEAPNYYSIISHPMDLSTIRKKIDAFEYRSGEDLMEDVALMCENCRTYCASRFPHLIPQADLVQDIAKESLSNVEPALLNVASLLWWPCEEEGT
eukprot:CAMPEP_0201525356 /NCGR_PEP_ID=MMETSP0161_2-20130828/27935_1 /ASSEMBLY_ACC=CAM_ASM_000251 /TAXON_ID=180227 /ORGANISM="Neoparamoeba aestuarina, Strain SoJaBio B1-5/56/2" /LENGTH=290 /DNA_ID=CAMNT_0047925243 /DNA_START=70 /DNA_END=939 /DNA_ORIENTATION=-